MVVVIQNKYLFVLLYYFLIIQPPQGHNEIPNKTIPVHAIYLEAYPSIAVF